MLYMNDYDIDSAARLAEREEWCVTAEAVGVLRRLVEWTDSVSDGWAYWPKPCRAAEKLQRLILDQDKRARDYRAEQRDVTNGDVALALRPIKSFLTREGVRPDVKAYILSGAGAL